MFKSKKQQSKEFIESRLPEKPPVQSEADRAIARGERIKRLSEEASMWRKFASGCASGRFLFEQHPFYSGLGMSAPPPRLELTMDEDSALLWSAFAQQMAEERERRLRESLAV